jgi:hypothetical protein
MPVPALTTLVFDFEFDPFVTGRLLRGTNSVLHDLDSTCGIILNVFQEENSII